MDNLKKELNNIIEHKQIKTFFQPIISLKTAEILGYEALSRVDCATTIKNAEMLFEIAKKCDRLWELEFICRGKAFESACNCKIADDSKKLFINVSPEIMRDENFNKGFNQEFLKQYNITAHDIIFEITEKSVIRDINSFIMTVEHYKSQDYKIAIDDVGAGYSGLNLISDLVPNYLKLDMGLIHGVKKHDLKAALIKAMVELSQTTNIDIIAEGIETKEELETLINLGVQYGQGYYIQRPDSKIRDISPEVIKEIRTINHRKPFDPLAGFADIPVGSLAASTGTIEPETMLADVYKLFKRDPDLFGLCVTEKGKPIGIITRENTIYQSSDGYYDLRKKPVSTIMDRDFMAVDQMTPVNVVSSLAMMRETEKLYDFIVITKNDNYTGSVTVKDLLTQAMEIETTKAKYQNSLSGLPGNLIIEQNINYYLKNGLAYSIAYFDINNFKAYNDVYGFKNGDSLIKLLAAILIKHFKNGEFIGHIGGDGFVVILNKVVTEKYFENIIKQFEAEVLEFYDQQDISQGYIITTNRLGKMEKFPLATITVVTVNSQEKNFNNKFELTEYLAAKKKLKKQMLYWAI